MIAKKLTLGDMIMNKFVKKGATLFLCGAIALGAMGCASSKAAVPNANQQKASMVAPNIKTVNEYMGILEKMKEGRETPKEAQRFLELHPQVLEIITQAMVLRMLNGEDLKLDEATMQMLKEKAASMLENVQNPQNSR